MTLKNNHILYRKSLEYKVAPKDSAWLKLNAKLEKSRNKRKISFYRMITIAAVLVALLSVISVFSFKEIQTDNMSSKTNTLAEVFDLEELSNTTGDGIYEINKLKALKSAYIKLGTKKQM